MFTAKRLNLHAVLPNEYLQLQHHLAHPDLCRKRGFTCPLRYFATNPNPLWYRASRAAANPVWAKYLLRVAVLK